MQESCAYEDLNRAWKSTCKVILGEEIGDLKEYESLLLENIEKPAIKKSEKTGKDVRFLEDKYCKNSKFLSFDEVDFNKKYDAIDINKIKDLDSIINEVQDRIYYTGNVVLGNSKYIEKSTNIMDCFYVYESSFISDSKYIAYSTLMRVSDHIFGGNFIGETSYSILSCNNWRTPRLFNAYVAMKCADIYCSQNLENCQECMFCFNLKSKKYCIGNLELEKSKYLELKKKLLEEIRDALKSKKYRTLLELANQIAKDDKQPEKSKKERKFEFNINEINESFSKTSYIIFGKKLENIDNYEKLLSKFTRRIEETSSALSGETVYMGDFGNGMKYPKSRLISLNEIEKAGTLFLDGKEVESLNLANAPKILKKISYMNYDFTVQSKNFSKCIYIWFSINSYKNVCPIYSKNTAFCFWPRDVENAYGCSMFFLSSFCINCYNSKYLSRCFECDSCENCTDLYFSHNCENVHDSMFCFNVKNKRNAIGNVEYPKEQYLKIKKIVLDQIAEKIEKNKDLKWNIYNLCKKP